MRRCNDFSLFTIADVPYLLPFGQGIADLKRGVQINDTGAYLWELLASERTEDEMLSLYAAHYQVPDCQLPQLKADLQEFLHMLDIYGMLTCSDHLTCSDGHSRSSVSDCSDENICSNAIPGSDGHNIANTLFSNIHARKQFPANAYAVRANVVQRYLSIGGLTLLLHGPSEAFSQEFDAFELSPDSGFAMASTPAIATILHIDQTITVTDHAPEPRAESSTLLKNHELTVMENDLQYIFLFPAAQRIYEAHLTKDGTDAHYYCRPPYTEDLRRDLFHAIRLSFLYLAQLHNMIVLHSASLLYRDRAWLFSGHSGAGKSTHTNLWKELYGVPVINGDLNLLSMENGCPMVHGMPWCGTSGIADTHSYPLGGILLVRKATRNYIATLDSSHAQLLVTQRLISPTWTESLLQKNLCLVAEIAPHILICRLHCTKEPEAAETAKQIIDDHLALLTADGCQP